MTEEQPDLQRRLDLPKVKVTTVSTNDDDKMKEEWIVNLLLFFLVG